MNENLKEIAVKAQVEHCVSHVRLEEFAELIVRECVKEARDDCAGWTERDQCLVMQVMDRIMLHFGVEECPLK